MLVPSKPPPGGEPADVLDTYPTSYYNTDYFWPELKVHWRLASNSPLTGYLQGRIMGGGSSVMGMVALMELRYFSRSAVCT